MSDEQAAAMAALDTASGEGSTVAPEGQATPSAPGEGQATEPFHRYKWENGKEDVWKSPDELNDWLRQSGMRHSDYTRKTQQVAEARKTLDQKIKDYEAKERTFNESYPQIMQYDKFLKENPQVAQRIAQEMRGKTGNTDVERLLGEKLKPLEEKLSRYEQEEQRRVEQEAREKAFGAVGGKYTDFDRKVIEAAIQRLEEVPEQMRGESLIETLYFAEKGRMTPGEIERRRAMETAKPKPATPTATVKEPDKKVNMTREEEEALAIAALEEARKSGK